MKSPHSLSLSLALGAVLSTVASAQTPDHDLELEFSVKEQRLRETLDVDRDGLHSTGDVRLGSDDVSFYWLRNGDANLIRDNGKLIGAENTFRLSTRFTKRVAGDDQLSTDEIRAAIDQSGDLFVGADVSGKLYGTKKGAGAGAGASVDIPLGKPAGTIAQGSIPLKLDMKIVSIKLVSQAAVTEGGVSAGVDAEFDVEWEGNVKLSASVGAGANVFRGLKGRFGIEIEIDKAEFKAAMRRAKELTKRFLKDAKTLAIAAKDASVRGARRTKDLATNYRGTGEKSDAPTATPAPGAPVDLSGKSPAEIAARFAPVIAQKLTDGSQNTLLRVDFDGDWDTRNNKDHAGSGDRTPAAYFDVKENATHYFVTYAFYFASEDHLIKRENDMEGAIVVARKGARAGEEVELVITTQTDGTQLTRYASKAAQDWESKADAARSGPAKFIDEVGHPHYDAERTHPQLYVTPRGHNVWAYNGRDDVNPFGGGQGVIYQPGLAPSAPSAGDTVGYALLPLSEVLDNATLKDGSRLRGGKLAKDKARLPNAWTTALEGFEPGALFRDPAGVINGWYGVPSAGLSGAVTGQ
ncbi:MAG: hypothetical protein KDD82_31290 [Planctomycetes bacterium]|nr:hypothetical protein [Planctomycetota bacterium]